MNFMPYTGLQWSDGWLLFDGLIATLIVTALAAVAGTVLGVVLGVLREESRVMRWLLALPVDILRSVPLIIQVILVNALLGIIGLRWEVLAVAVVALALYMAAFTSEIVRGGIKSVPLATRRAARSLGMNRLQELWHVTLPIAARNVLPSWIGVLLGLVKDSSLVAVVGYVELLRASQILINRSNQALLLLCIAGTVYFAICYPISLLSRRWEKANRT